LQSEAITLQRAIGHLISLGIGQLIELLRRFRPFIVRARYFLKGRPDNRPTLFGSVEKPHLNASVEQPDLQGSGNDADLHWNDNSDLKK
jgi:hypothetical protein